MKDRSITPLQPADFTPEMGNYKTLQPFRYWCQKVLPLVYDNSLSYYELLCKVVDYLNKTMEDVETLYGDVTNLHTAYEELQSYVNNYFSTLDVQEEINNKLDNMASSGELYEIIRRYTDPIVNEQNEQINVLKARMDTFASLPEGSTSGNAELADIRAGYNGTVYPSAGDAVREQVGALNSDLSGYIYKEKIVTKGNELGWYALEGGQIKEKEHNLWTRLHLTKPLAFNSMRFTIGSQIKCVFTVVNGNVTTYEQVGAYDIDISKASDVYMNFFGNSFVDKYYLYYAYKPYEEGFINFIVKINQHVITINDTENKLIDNEDNLNNVTCYIKLPKSYRPYGKKTKLLMLCHGAGMGVTIANPSTGLTWETYNHYNNLVNTFVDAGYAVFDCNGYNETFFGCNFWGAHRGVEAWIKAYDYIIKNYNVEENVAIYGFSMGGLTALNLVLNGFPNAKCVALGSPVIDVEKCWEDGSASQIREAYGMGSAYEPEKVIGSNPITRIITIDNTDYCFANIPPIKVWYGSTEVGTAVNKNYAVRLVNAIRNAGSWAVYREVTGAGHDICFGANENCNKEYLYWINRFNS